jgi:hypothetical protein
VWDLFVLAFERSAWLDLVLRPAADAGEAPSETQLAAYLERGLDTTI